MGGRICINFALEHQEMVGGLVLVGSVGVDENRERIKTIRVPTLIVWGEKDHIAPISNAEFLNREITGSKLLVIPGGKHPAYLDNPEMFHDALLEFLREIS